MDLPSGTWCGQGWGKGRTEGRTSARPCPQRFRARQLRDVSSNDIARLLRFSSTTEIHQVQLGEKDHGGLSCAVTGTPGLPTWIWSQPVRSSWVESRRVPRRSAAWMMPQADLIVLGVLLGPQGRLVSTLDPHSGCLLVPCTQPDAPEEPLHLRPSTPLRHGAGERNL